MKKLKLKTRIFTTLLVLLFLTACYEFDFVNQPNQADPNSFFEVQISATNNSLADSTESYFGILMPVGWTTTDSIDYVNISTADTGVWVYSESITQQMSSIDPPPENYYWWVGKTIIDGAHDDIFNWDFKIFTDGQTGNFFLDYMLGDNEDRTMLFYGSGLGGINFRRSDSHLIIVGEPVGCLSEGISFSTQEEIDNFSVNHPNCTEIAGNVLISGNYITNLSGLDILTSIGGNLKIENNEALINFSGIDNLTNIGGALSIINNTSLSSLSGLYNLNSIGRDLWIETNNSLVNVIALDNVNHIGENLAIIDNAVLSNLSGLELITMLGGCLRIENNEVLTSLSGLDNLISIESGLFIENNNSLTDLSTLNTLSSNPGWDLRINGNETLTSLNGLQNVGPIGRDVILCYNLSLESLADFDNLTSIGGTLRIEGNETLKSFSGLENLTSIEGDGIIGYGYPGLSYGFISNGNPSLMNMAGLDNLASIGGSLEIHCNDSLIDLTGLDNLANIGEDLIIGIMVNPRNGGPYYLGNPSLINLNGLENLSSIGGDIEILGNAVLSDLYGIDNVDPNSIINLDFHHNDSLSSCEALSICDYLASPNGVITIHTNAPGCNNPPEIAQACGNTMPCLPYGPYYFFTQFEIDNFQFSYPGCTQLEGDVLISGDDIANLNGLSVITSFEGNLKISNNPLLVNLSGLDNVVFIGENLYIYNNDNLTSLTGLEGMTSFEGNLHIGYSADGNQSLASLTGLENVTSIMGNMAIRNGDALTNLMGLENLTSIGGTLNIYSNSSLTSLSGLNSLTSIGGKFEVFHNSSLHNLKGLDSLASIDGSIYVFFSSLTSFIGLENLTSIGGFMDIRYNYALSNLSGFENIDPNSINSLQIMSNPSLCTCEVQSICDYLTNYNGSIHLSGNATGCNSKQEVLDACATLSCLPEGITFTTQEEIDNFQTNYPYCNEIEGDVIIEGDGITNLDGLSVLNSISGFL